MQGCLLPALTLQKLAVDAAGMSCKQVYDSKLHFSMNCCSVLTYFPVLTQGCALLQNRRCCSEQPSVGSTKKNQPEVML